MLFTRQKLRAFFENFPRLGGADRRVLFICIGVALVFWLILNLSREYSVNRTVSINFLPPADRILVAPPEPEVDLVVTGPGWDLFWENVINPELSLTVQVTDDDDGRVSRGDVARLIERQLAGGELRITDLSFTEVQLRTEPKFDKRIPVRPVSELDYATGFLPVSQPSCAPDSITISGLKATLDSIQFWPTDTLKVAALAGDLSSEVGLAEFPQGIECATTTVRLEQKVQVLTEKSLFVPVTVRHPPERDSFVIFPNRVRLKVGVLMSEFQSIVADSFLLTADLTKGRSGGQAQNIPLTLEEKPLTAISVSFMPRSTELRLIQRQR